jgi:hypothetical protein
MGTTLAWTGDHPARGRGGRSRRRGRAEPAREEEEEEEENGDPKTYGVFAVMLSKMTGSPW